MGRVAASVLEVTDPCDHQGDTILMGRVAASVLEVADPRDHQGIPIAIGIPKLSSPK
jgi:hypothetical protein